MRRRRNPARGPSSSERIAESEACYQVIVLCRDRPRRHGLAVLAARNTGFPWSGILAIGDQVLEALRTPSRFWHLGVVVTHGSGLAPFARLPGVDD